MLTDENLIRKLLPKNCPEYLYHYTDLNGLLGICRNKNIWATKIHYLNDYKEHSYAFDILQNVYERAIAQVFPKHKPILIEAFNETMDYFDRSNICVASLSTNGDILSQWRGYCGVDSRYSLGFSTTKLEDVISQSDFFLAPCIYAKEKQEDLIVSFLVQKLYFWKNIGFDNFDKLSLDEITCNAMFIIQELSELAPVIKHPAFSEEAEWRLISKGALRCTSSNFDFRNGGSALIPYAKIPLEAKDKTFPLCEIIVGPNPDINSASCSIETFLVSLGLSDTVRVIKSDTPFRTW